MEKYSKEDLIVVGTVESGKSKKNVIYNPLDNTKYIIKYPKYKDYGDHIAEHIACKLLNTLGIRAQNTKMAEIDGELVVMCEFIDNIIQLKDIASYLNSEKVLDFDSLLELESTDKNLVEINTFRQKMVELTYLSYIFKNVDLHPGNIGFIKGEYGYKFSPIYDFGSSLSCKYYRSPDKLKSDLLKPIETILIFHKKVNITEFSKRYPVPEHIKKINLNRNWNMVYGNILNDMPDMYGYYVEYAIQSVIKNIKFLKEIENNNTNNMFSWE